ncbi:glycosyltransferase, group 2 family protein [Fusobacterium sp. CM21]|uniref:glycosyltransferase family 2 protein n=1 Tax=Fusobacterium nucleatum TaxID=851 RepID=UPI0003E1FC31|nr:glycosyltransferase family 2 protein [Fusobacterium nucleatum]ETT12291.1 glycosyltransferase, group 2 family protein [Fusobacterium sp. CM21]OHU81703.1 hypothetical protein BKN39_07775 [Fusobacterium nucleatum]
MKYKENLKEIAILTPTFNRKELLKDVYNSLQRQSIKNFKWIIVDDGSTDGTDEVVQNFKNKDFEVEYIYKENHGKHTAINLGLKCIEEKLIMILDSDDVLKNDSIEKILSYWKIFSDEGLAGMVFLKENKYNEIIGDKFRKDVFIENYIEIVENQKVSGDKAEVWVTEILKKYPFPIFPNENFIGESVVWYEISKKYNMAFINVSIQICEYSVGGLTKLGRKLRLKNPKGGMLSSKVTFSNKFKKRVIVKKMILYIVYSLFAKQNLKKTFKESSYKWIFLLVFPIAFFLYLFWKKEYKL